MTKPYTDADVEVVAEAIDDAPWPCEHSNPKSTDPCDWWTCPQCQAAAVLDALAAAGRLAPVAPQHHVIAFDVDGTWSLEHPATCRAENDADDAADWDCGVRKLAEQQVTSEMAGLLGDWRYECSANDLEDVFLLGDRVDRAVS